MKIRFLIFVASLCICLSGCQTSGDMKVDKESENAGNHLQNTLCEQLKADETWTEVINTPDGKSIEIDVRVQVPSVKSLNVYAAKKKKIDTATRKSYLEKYNTGTLLACKNDDPYSAGLGDLELVPNWEEHTGDYTDNYYGVEYRDREYFMYFNDADDFKWGNMMTLLPMDKITGTGSDYFITLNFDASVTENVCALGQEDAISQAVAFANELTGQSFDVINTYPLVWGDDTKANGYEIYLRRTIDGVPLDGNYYYWMNFMMHRYYDVYPNAYGSLEKMHVYINDDGILGFQYIGMREEGELVAEDVKLLDFEKVKESLRIALIENVDGMFSDLYLGTLELLYFPLWDTEEPERFTIIPVWRLLADEDADKAESVVMINAMDGSLIDIESNIFLEPEGE